MNFKIGCIFFYYLSSLCFVLNAINAQENVKFYFKALYEYSIQPDSNDVKIKQSEPTILLVNDSMSIFEAYNRYLFDSSEYADYVRVGHRTVSPINAMRYMSFFPDQLFKQNSGVVTMHRVAQSFWKFQYTDTIKLNWNIKSDTLLIGDIKCQKAECDYGGRHWIAWFAPSIPLNNGPYVFSGLPGLIFNIKDTQGFFEWNLISAGPANIQYVTFPDKSERKTTKSEYFDFKNTFHYWDGTNGTGMKRIGPPPSAADKMIGMKRSEEQFKKNNNFIEK